MISESDKLKTNGKKELPSHYTPYEGDIVIYELSSKKQVGLILYIEESSELQTKEDACAKKETEIEASVNGKTIYICKMRNLIGKDEEVYNCKKVFSKIRDGIEKRENISAINPNQILDGRHVYPTKTIFEKYFDSSTGCLQYTYRGINSFLRGFIFFLSYLVTLTCVIWCVLGLFIFPERFGPYTTGIFVVITNAKVLYAKTKAYCDKIKDLVNAGLQKQTKAMDSKENVASNINELELGKIMRDFHISTKDVVVAVLVSSISLVGLIVFLLVGMNVFTDSDPFSAALTSGLTVSAGVATNLRSSNVTSGNENLLVAKIISAYEARQGKKGTVSVDDKLEDKIRH
jgi:hypothetical protein